MQLDKAKELIATFSFPKAEFSIHGSRDPFDFYGFGGGLVTFRITWTVEDSDNPGKIINVYSNYTGLTIAAMDEKEVKNKFFEMVKYFQVHEASEKFKINGAAPWHPHADRAHDEAIAENSRRDKRKTICYT